MTRASHTTAMARLVQQFSRLPGIGKRTAERLAFHLLKQPDEEALELAAAIGDLKRNVRHCRLCFNLTDIDPASPQDAPLCSICADPRRDQGLVLVVEQPNDVVTIETTGMFAGVYHVLMGRLSPLDGVGAGDINIEALLRRVEQGGVREIVLGTHPDLEGDGTAMYLAQRLAKAGVKVSRLARGLPTGANLELVSKAVLADAIEGRQEMK